MPLDLLIVGAGFSGLYMLHRARIMGLSARVLDAAPSVGGTWYANRYPGARVDIQSLEYSFSFSEALQQEWRWTERYASQPELLRYANHVADRFDLRRDITLNTRVTSACFDDAAQRWEVGGIGADGEPRAWLARFLVLANGPLSSPYTPGFPGLESFAGPVLHTAAWPHVPVDFSGRHVGVVGTGSSAVQVIPRVAQQAASVTVFQRTAAYVVPAHNGPLDPAHEARVKADYAGFRARNRQMGTGFGCELPPNPASALAASPQERDAAFEARWRAGGFGLLGAYGDLMLDLQANALAAEFVRGMIREAVHDPATAALLSPQQPIGCKRLCVADGYYETFNRANVRLVDVSDQSIEAITPGGLRAGGRERLRHAGAGHRLRRGDRAADAAGPAWPRRAEDSGQVARRAAELLGLDSGGISEPVQHCGRWQHLGLHQRDRLHRAPCGLDRRVHRLDGRAGARDDRGHRGRGARLGRTCQCDCRTHRVFELQFLVSGCEHTGQAAHVHAAGWRLPRLRATLCDGGGPRLRWIFPRLAARRERRPWHDR
ncbi:NAD(P)/FAD-dependent oxidoreductase [Variovorax sp. dw_308]|uniref:flavin-containing monooxygenase n=1 Tax=Variovorax sp. dw_308 TaxID=2721546 RepID=UPI002109D317|nr:NAD(P)/FAD-dependent oxidoreductase [Variovorax sp. dw_308]